LENGYWWRNAQGQLGQNAMVVPVILYSDETKPRIVGNAKYYPVYLTIGNLPGKFRRNKTAYTLVGLIPSVLGTEQQNPVYSIIALN